jgi:hypothetical protein
MINDKIYKYHFLIKSNQVIINLLPVKLLQNINRRKFPWLIHCVTKKEVIKIVN